MHPCKCPSKWEQSVEGRSRELRCTWPSPELTRWSLVRNGASRAVLPAPVLHSPPHPRGSKER